MENFIPLNSDRILEKSSDFAKISVSPHTLIMPTALCLTKQ